MWLRLCFVVLCCVCLGFGFVGLLVGAGSVWAVLLCVCSCFDVFCFLQVCVCDFCVLFGGLHMCLVFVLICLFVAVVCFVFRLFLVRFLFVFGFGMILFLFVLFDVFVVLVVYWVL